MSKPFYCIFGELPGGCVHQAALTRNQAKSLLRHVVNTDYSSVGFRKMEINDMRGVSYLPQPGRYIRTYLVIGVM